MKGEQALKKLQDGTLDACLSALYGEAALTAQKERYADAIAKAMALFGAERDLVLCSVPGRTELSGNHTDHNRGLALAAAVDADILAVVARREDTIIRVTSEGFGTDEVDISKDFSPRLGGYGRSDALIAGVARGLSDAGFPAGGFDAYTTSSVPAGAGLSSSAAFEILIGHIENQLYHGGNIPTLTLAKIAQFAENEFFGKPCGLLDQLATATGGIIAIDFENANAPQVEPIHFDLNEAGLALCIVETGGSHADLTADYAAVPAEMKAVASELGGEVLREVDEHAILANFSHLRERVGDRAVLRAMHFFAENRRVHEQIAALRAGDVEQFLSHVKGSGHSSFEYLQNLYSPAHPNEQGLSLALCLAERFLANKRGACRVHGGGFAGTVQILVESTHANELCSLMDTAFGKGSCHLLRIRPQGAATIE